MGASDLITKLCRDIRSFGASQSGNIAITFALSLLPVVAGIGAAVDYSHANSIKSSMQQAADSTALALCQSATSMSSSQLQTTATSYFKAGLNRPEATGVSVSAVSSGQGGACTLAVTAAASMQTAFLGIVGVSQVSVGASSTATLGTSKLQVALVLDNTGSMNATDVAPTRIGALRSAAQQFLNTLQAAAATPGDIQVAIVPFTNGVNVGTTNVNAAWLDWQYYSNSGGAGDDDYGSSWNNNNWSGNNGNSGNSNNNSSYNNYSSSAYGQSYWNPWTKSYSQYAFSCANWSGCWSNAVSLATPNWVGNSQVTSWNAGACHWSSCWAGNGAWSTTSNTTNKNGWQGCVMDRDQSYDVQNTAPNTATKSTLFPAVFSPWCPTALMPLSNNWTAMQTKISSMVATGTTNQTIGLVWGWLALTGGAPLNAPTPPAGTSQVIVLMTDGLNTENRWSTDQATIDARTQLVCSNIQAAGIKIYTILVRMGDSSVLQQCAGNANRYFVVNDATALNTAFSTIATALTKLRLAK